MEKIRPGINVQGLRRALREYGNEPNRVLEELVANSYDADSTNAAIVYSKNWITIIDNGSGIESSEFSRLLVMGAGTRLGSSDSRLKRSYLGSFGFGFKATSNISKLINVISINRLHTKSAEIVTKEMETRMPDKDWEGFDVRVERNPKGKLTGTAIKLELENELTDEQIENIKKSLANLPKSKDFRVYFAPSRNTPKALHSATTKAILELKQLVRPLTKFRISGNLEIGKPKFVKCKIPGFDDIDIAVWCKGLDVDMKVKSLGQFAGVYVKVDGRVLKRNFQGEKVLDGISKFPKFKHGMRLEIPFDWVKDQISLGRDGLQFANEASRKKFENELKFIVSQAVRPFAQQLDKRKKSAFAKQAQLRIRKAEERIKQKQTIKSLERTGFSFAAQDDYEMALLIANPVVLKKINPDWKLMDFNGQQEFDCLIHDRKTNDFIKVELEPDLERFVAQAALENTDFIISWTRGGWQVGKGKQGKGGWFELLENKGYGPGHYKLLVKKNKKSKDTKKELPVFCVDKVFK
jgi:hypothetical protein